MQTQTKSTAVSRQVGQGTEHGKPGRQAVRGIRGKATVAAPLVLGGFRSVNFKSKGGSYVYSHIKRIFPEEVSLEKIYNDLYKCFQAYHCLLHGVLPDLNFISITSSTAAALEKLLTAFGLLAQPNEFNVDRKETGEYIFIIYAVTPWKYQWHVFDIKKAVVKLKKKSKLVHDLFLSFIKALDQLGIDCWFEYSYGHVLDSMQDWLDIDEGDMDEEDTAASIKVLHCYSNGKAAKYQSLICNAPLLTIDELRIKASKLRSCPEILELIKKGCALLDDGKSLNNYDYDPNDDNDGWGEYGLRLQCQIGILWDANDLYTGRLEDYIDAEANEGTKEPHQALFVDENCNQLFIPDPWTGKLSKFMIEANGLIQNFTK